MYKFYNNQLPLVFDSYFPRGGLLYITDRDARRNFQEKPLKVTTLSVAPANYIP